VKKRMRVTRHLMFFLSSLLMLAAGCQTENREHADELTALRQQVAILTRELEDTQERMNVLQHSMQEDRRELSSLRAEVERFKAQDTSARVEAAKAQPLASAAPQSPQVQPVACAEVWKLLGQGKDEATVTRTLHITPERVRACEQQVGRARLRR